MQIIRRLGLLSVLVSLLYLVGCGQTGLTPAEHVARAKDAIDKDDLRSASIELLNALRQEPNTLEARWLLAQVSVELGDGARAEKEVRKAMELGLVRVAAQPTLVKAIYLQGDLDRVLRETASLADGMSEAKQALILGLRAQAYVGKQAFAQAKETLDMALELNRATTTALVGMAMLHGIQRDYAEARRWSGLALDADASSAEAWSLLGDIELAQGNAAEAETAFSNAIKFRKYPTMDIAKRALARIQLKSFPDADADIRTLREQGFKDHPYVDYVAGISFFRQGRYPEAEEAFRASYTRVPSFLPTKMYLATTHYILGNLEQARDFAEHVSAEVPRYSGAKRLLGAIEISRSEFDAATDVLQKSLRDSPNDAMILNMLTTVSLLAGNTSEGVKYAQEIVSLAPESRQTRDMLMMAKLLDGQALDKNLTESLERASRDDDYTREFLYAAEAFRDGKLGEALQRARKLHERYPDNVDPINLMAACYLAAGQWDKAKIEFENVLELQPNEPSAARNLAKVEVQEGKLERAQTLLKPLVEAYPGEEEAILLLADIEARLGSQADRVGVLEQALERNPGALTVRTKLTDEYLRDGRVAKVLELTRDLTAIQLEEQPKLLELRGKAQMLGGDLASAEHSFARWTEVVPDSAPAHFLYGDSLARSGKVDEAREQLEHALQLDPNYVPARVGEVKMLVQAGEMERAKQVLTKVKRDFGDRPEVLGIEGWFALGTGDYATAAERLSAVAEQKPNTELTILLVRALWAQQKHDQAIDVMQTWLQERPRDLAVLLHLAGAYLSLNREKDARAMYAKVVEIYPNHVVALNNLAWLSRNKDLKQAIVHAERANQLAPNDPTVLDTLGMLLLKSGDVSRGIKMIRNAVDRAPETPEIQLHLGRALVQQEQFTEAQEVLSTLVTKAPNSQAADEAKALLEAIPKQ